MYQQINSGRLNVSPDLCSLQKERKGSFRRTCFVADWNNVKMLVIQREGPRNPGFMTHELYHKDLVSRNHVRPCSESISIWFIRMTKLLLPMAGWGITQIFQQSGEKELNLFSNTCQRREIWKKFPEAGAFEWDLKRRHRAPESTKANYFCQASRVSERIMCLENKMANFASQRAREHVCTFA
jgi:hypothetical protein